MSISMDSEEDEYHRYRYRDPSAPRNQNNTPSIWFSKRFLVAVLLFIGYFLHGTVCQVSGITIEAMTTNRIISSGNQTTVQLKEFDWDSRTIEMVSTTFLTGFLFSLLGGYLAQKCGGSTVFGFSMMLTGLILFFVPIAARTQFYLFLLLQGLLGLLQSFCLVSTAEIFACWIPKKERTAVMVCIISGMFLGSAIPYFYLHFSNNINDYPWPIYPKAAGLRCFVWSVVWLIIVRNEPLKDEQITEKELVYILQQTDTIMRKRDVEQFKNIMVSPPCWALFTAKYTLGWASAFAVAYFPLNFIKGTSPLADITNNQIENGTKESLIFIPIANSVNIFIILFVGLLIAYWQSITDLKPTQFHKIIIGVSFSIAAIFSLILALTFTFFANHFALLIICLTVIKCILSYSYVILEIVTINVAPNHTSILSGMGLFWQTVGTIFVQTVIRFTVQNYKLEDWQIFFYSSAITLVLCVMTFIFLGSSKPQPWSTIWNRNTYEGRCTRNTELLEIANNTNQ